MAENNTKRGPGHDPGGPRGGFRKPKDLRGTLGKLMRYLGAVQGAAGDCGDPAGDQLRLLRGQAPISSSP